MHSLALVSGDKPQMQLMRAQVWIVTLSSLSLNYTGDVSPNQGRSRKAARDNAVAVIKSLAAPTAVSAEEMQLRKEELLLKKEELALTRLRLENDFELRKQELKQNAEARAEELKLQRELILRFVPKQ